MADRHNETECNFPFWSGAELIRIGVIGGMLAIPFAVAGNESSVIAAQGSAHPQTLEHASAGSGRLRAVRVTTLDMSTLAPSLLGDRDE